MTTLKRWILVIGGLLVFAPLVLVDVEGHPGFSSSDRMFNIVALNTWAVTVLTELVRKIHIAATFQAVGVLLIFWVLRQLPLSAAAPPRQTPPPPLR